MEQSPERSSPSKQPEEHLQQKIRESQRNFMMTEIPLNLALKRIKEVQEVLPQVGTRLVDGGRCNL